MPSEKTPFYDPIPPTYDQAVASGSHYDPDDWAPAPRSPTNERNATEAESQGLLQHSSGGASSSRRPDGYRPPTVETDDEDSLWASDSESDDEAAQVRREMQEMEIEEPDRSRGSQWGKRIGSYLTLPRWKWSWRPRLPRLRIQLPQRADAPAADNAENATGENEETPSQTTRRWNIPKVDKTTVILFCVRILALTIILGFFYLLFASDMFGGLSDRLGGGFRFNPEDLRAHLLRTVDPMRMRASVQHFSNYAHIAGTEGDYATALDVQAMFSRALLDEVMMDEYQVYLNYPRKDGRVVQIMDEKDLKKAKWTAKLEEEEVGGETAGRQTYAFHGYSKSGDVKGPLIYANYGTRDDFKHLTSKGVNATGAIALVKNGGPLENQALKVKAAELAGFAGCLIYSDPADDGFKKGVVAPEGLYMPSDGVQRGSVGLTNWGIGDPLSPGYGSKGDQRITLDKANGLVGIPSLPLAWRDAKVLLQHLKGYGEKVPNKWEGGVPDVEWWTGSEKSPIVRLKNEQDEDSLHTIWNVYGRINGMEQTSKSIIIGNQRDSWAFGATDPHSGTAVMIEMARIFGDLVQRGWRPLRTIEFMSWDASAYNLIGSTEYVEHNSEALRDNAFAYLNLGAAVVGKDLHASGSPVFRKSLIHALGRVIDPSTNSTLKDLWEQSHAELKQPEGRGDHIPFQDIAGTSALDLAFRGTQVPHHSSYDKIGLVDNFIDPDFEYHGAMGQVIALLILDMADRPIMPFDMGWYAQRLGQWVKDLEKWALKKMDGQPKGEKDAFKELKDAATLVQHNVATFEKWEMEWDREVLGNGGWEANDIGASRLAYNNKMAYFETALLDLEIGGGIPNRTQFKSVVFGPDAWSNDGAIFPAIRDYIEEGNWKAAKPIVAKTAALLRKAATILEMQ
ncbi:n-acetylated-alpha-linked acidic dipeptidase 2 [Fusarium pseudocircinatum]|uniref:N-acetylated-alpha-linked acidic dipeptidase 2 n=1 Tax=Fusarium pseudocircinatum TaxID=56676 RepID=A0A8H5KW81_9HYPO|nr:n-acetylated-alpha-linked acidic dipeptidase 2 [Fusarium pseudocircinatum]